MLASLANLTFSIPSDEEDEEDDKVGVTENDTKNNYVAPRVPNLLPTSAPAPSSLPLPPPQPWFVTSRATWSTPSDTTDDEWNISSIKSPPPPKLSLPPSNIEVNEKGMLSSLANLTFVIPCETEEKDNLNDDHIEPSNDLHPQSSTITPSSLLAAKLKLHAPPKIESEIICDWCGSNWLHTTTPHVNPSIINGNNGRDPQQCEMAHVRCLSKLALQIQPDAMSQAFTQLKALPSSSSSSVNNEGFWLASYKGRLEAMKGYLDDGADPNFTICKYPSLSTRLAFLPAALNDPYTYR
jgi:hypothetical protein